MARKVFELPDAVAGKFLRGMRDYFAEKDGVKRDLIVADQAWLLSQHTPKTIKFHEVKELFHAMRDQV